MMKKTLWLIVTASIAMSLVVTACQPPKTESVTPTTPVLPAPTTPTATPTPTTPVTEKPQQEPVKPAAETPKYGGVLNWAQSTDPTAWDQFGTRTGGTMTVTNMEMWFGDWTKGPAGGYGTKETDWIGTYSSDRFDHKVGFIAESTTWTIDDAKNEGTINYKIRPGIHFGLNPNSEASRLVNGREVTADDVIFSLNLATKDSRHVLYTTNPELRTANITRTGPAEISVKLPLDALITGISRFGDTMPIVPSEVYQKYGSMSNWKNSVGAGPFMLTDYVPGSQLIFTRNSKFYLTDPIGPGKGNQLPYLDGFKTFVIPDLSTRRAALRTAKIDRIDGETGVSWDEIGQFRKTAKGIKELELIAGGGFAIKFVVDEPPFNDIKVRRAMLMAIDFSSINTNLYGGKGRILTYPFGYAKEYAKLYVDFNDPDFPATAKELYSYDPEKAKQLLKDAGYPNGIKTSALVTSTEVDEYAVYKDMWSKIGVELSLDVRETGTKNNIIRSGTVKGMSSSGGNPTAIFFTNPDQTQGSTTNPGRINDPVINDFMSQIRKTAIRDMDKAMGITRQLIIYSYDQAFAVPRSSGPTYRLWWPWVKNYSGEHSIGYGNPELWLMYVWLDKDLKKSMGY